MNRAITDEEMVRLRDAAGTGVMKYFLFPVVPRLRGMGSGWRLKHVVPGELPCRHAWAVNLTGLGGARDE